MIWTILRIFVLASIVAMVFCIKTNKKSICSLRDRNNELAKINELLSGSINKNKIFFKEIHHRVKNNLQLVMSLLNCQNQDFQSDSINEFLEKGHLRISTMALIHQTLYHSENFQRVDFQEYLENLTKNIKNIFDANHVEILVNTNGNNFDLETTIPLGLIINELVCNALKYAFQGESKCKIYIIINEKKLENVFELNIGDNGNGIRSSHYVSTFRGEGLELVNLLVFQLKGKIEKINKSGTHYRIEFTNNNDY